MQITAKWLHKLDFEGHTSSHQVPMSGIGSSDLGPTPMEIVLMGLGGCTGMDTVAILEKMRVEFDRFEVLVEGDRAEDHPKVFTHLNVVYRIWGEDIPEDKLSRAVELTQEKYCSVLHMLNKTATVDHRYEINPAE